MRLAAFVSALLAPLAVWAQGTGQAPAPASKPQAGGAVSAQVRKLMGEMDANHDGTVSRDEFMAYPRRMDQKLFDRVDSNKDGAISREEYMAPGAGRGSAETRAEHFRLLDTNGDGRITREELDARRNARFDQLDANKDGQLTPQELRSAQNAMRRDALDPGAR